HGHRTMHYMLRNHEGEPNLLRILRDHGYYVWWGGKNDLIPGQLGYGEDCDVKFSPSEQDYKRWGHIPKPGLHSWTPWRGEPDSESYYSFYAGKLPTGDDDIYCDGDWAMVLGAIDFIKSCRGGKPLCIYLPLLYPHPPYGVEEPWFSMIDKELVPPRVPTPPDWHDKASILQGIAGGQHLQSWTEDQWQALRATYYGMCARLDHQFGLLIQALKDTGIYDDTAVYLFADHGDYTGDYGIVEKTQNTFEDALSRVPFIVKPPKSIKVKPGVSEALIELVDFSATVYDMTGIDPGYWSFGRSLLPVISGEVEEHRDAIFCEGGRLIGEEQAMEKPSLDRFGNPALSMYWPRIRLQTSDAQPWHTKAAMCRTKNYKYIRRHYELDELYDLQNDPLETVNLIHHPDYTDILLHLKERLLTWYMETCDIVPFDMDNRS
ncbi:MAG: sulfatase-like hydrolase/transferase, partial [Anaerolineae bacterium]|nr:sulfatase-like hydrolase/transferase [Anaerolineae bacterium]